MNKYTIGALFTPDFEQVLLILKNKPKWQAGKYNLPGGSIEDGETSHDCVVREFEEEAGLMVSSWQHVGQINNPGNYYVDMLTSICYNPQDLKQPTEEKCEWVKCSDLPENVISNLHWLIPFAKNFWKQGNADGLKFGHFTYTYND